MSLLNHVAVLCSLALGVAREPAEAEVRRACRKLSKTCHPDRSGKREQQQSLNSASSAWEEAETVAKGRASKKAENKKRQQQERYLAVGVVVPARSQNFTKEFRFRGAACVVI